MRRQATDRRRPTCYHHHHLKGLFSELSHSFGHKIEATPIVEHRNAPGLPQMFAVRAEHIDLATNEGTSYGSLAPFWSVRRAAVGVVELPQAWE